MITYTISRVTDLYIKLLESRTSGNKGILEKYIDPIYADAHEIYQHLKESFFHINARLDDEPVQVDILTAYIDSNRQKYMPLRYKLRSIVSGWQQYNSTPIAKFEKGILGVILSILSHLENAHQGDDIWFIDDLHVGLYNWQDQMTLLDFLWQLNNGKETSNNIIMQHIDSLESAWKDVNEGYINLSYAYKNR